ncbi:hypothetical protein TPHA_0C01010 [Tetrapisispora phaffii CBS 4417]|uniref:Long chronological lifespan protein 2 n=1 Tax=Tetrapisispora phaffii (strain ATCC 24235 / CBS 4417 / NBRC 1672 / NRRL Y-8282 / UCD 70-5) TaxID=1071381 RepID=G8BR81_TETPH|nr:hypothetical protein TPHA_0C01010 [Tetrapisispora phaffii CBS 4417]CCE62257.1 hypothetical protein TPHA_0C01010 [Tetrapisispora phaffii CBS 4417]
MRLTTFIYSLVAYSLIFIPFTNAFFNFGGGHNAGHGQRNRENTAAQGSYEDRYLANNCQGYLCPDTLECVSYPSDCPCPFPASQLKCGLPDGNYICISKPASKDDAVNNIYDNPNQNSQFKMEGMRDCGWVLDEYYGKL